MFVKIVREGSTLIMYKHVYGRHVVLYIPRYAVFQANQLQMA